MSKKQQNTGNKKRKHGVYSWLRTGRVNPSIRGYKKLQSYLEDMERELIESQGGPGKLTAGKEILIKSVIEAYGVILLAAMYVKKDGIIRPDLLEKGVIELQPVLGKQFLSFINTIRQNLLALGLDEKAEEVPPLDALVADIVSKRREKRPESAQDDETPEDE